MKKVISIVLIVAILFQPLIVNACTGTDRNGREYHHDHGNTDSTIWPMIYAEPNHLYRKNVRIINNRPNEDIIVSEAFAFPLIKSMIAHVGWYWNVDERLTDFHWENVDNLNIETTINGIDYMLVGQSSFRLNVGLKNTFLGLTADASETIEVMEYNVFAENIAIKESNEHNLIARRIVANRELEQVVPEIIKISADIMTTTESFEVDTREITALYDNIEVQIPTDNMRNNVVAINLNNLNSDYVIPVRYENNNFKFEINEPGIYMLISADFDRELFDSDFSEELNVDEDNEKGSRELIISIFVGIIIIVVAVFIILLKKARKKSKN